MWTFLFRRERTQRARRQEVKGEEGLSTSCRHILAPLQTRTNRCIILTFSCAQIWPHARADGERWGLAGGCVEDDDDECRRRRRRRHRQRWRWVEWNLALFGAEYIKSHECALDTRRCLFLRAEGVLDFFLGIFGWRERRRGGRWNLQITARSDMLIVFDSAPKLCNMLAQIEWKICALVSWKPIRITIIRKINQFPTAPHEPIPFGQIPPLWIRLLSTPVSVCGWVCVCASSHLVVAGQIHTRTHVAHSFGWWHAVGAAYSFYAHDTQTHKHTQLVANVMHYFASDSIHSIHT